MYINVMSLNTTPLNLHHGHIAISVSKFLKMYLQRSIYLSLSVLLLLRDSSMQKSTSRRNISAGIYH